MSGGEGERVSKGLGDLHGRESWDSVIRDIVGVRCAGGFECWSWREGTGLMAGCFGILYRARLIWVGLRVRKGFRGSQIYLVLLLSLFKK